jgi:hypothetical protein
MKKIFLISVLIFGSNFFAQNFKLGGFLSYSNQTIRNSTIPSTIIFQKTTINEFSTGLKLEKFIGSHLSIIAEVSLGKSYAKDFLEDSIVIPWMNNFTGNVENLNSISQQEILQSALRIDPRIICNIHLTDDFSIQGGVNYSLHKSLILPELQYTLDHSDISQTEFSPLVSDEVILESNINWFAQNASKYDLFLNDTGMLTPVFGIRYSYGSFDLSLRRCNRLTQFILCYNFLSE